jgi:hypothetical protein
MKKIEALQSQVPSPEDRAKLRPRTVLVPGQQCFCSPEFRPI